MRKLIVQTFLSLDGVMQAPGGPDEDTSGRFRYGGWSVTYWDSVMQDAMGAAVSVPFAMLLGRRTYEIFAAHWPHAGEEDGAPIFNNATKYVASRTLKKVGWQNSLLLKGSVPKAVAKLKGESGPEIQVHGSANLVQTLLKHDLVDEIRLWIFPVLLGKGKRLFAEGTQPRGLSLVSGRMSTTGVAMNVYRPAGEVPIGSFAL
ncbi:MAG TPA: dihydrofolate reductase family protein [Gemmatimonadaceae bacterium]|nr:dihydrofolate reductase family protein [Gemmatimonadaceae bacterium]